MRKLVFAISLLALSSVSASADPIADRQALMKERGKIVGSLSKIVKGEQPFDAAAVLTALQQLEANAEATNFEKLFPPGTEEGGDTTASPKIWEDFADFTALEDKYLENVKAAVASPPADVDALKAQIGTLGGDCSSCHQNYRVKRG